MGVDFVASPPREAFRARPSDMTSKKSDTSLGSGPQRVLKEIEGIKSGEDLDALLDAAENETDYNINFDDGTKQMAFLHTAQPNQTKIIESLCQAFSIDLTVLELELYTSGSYDKDAVYAPSGSSVNVDFIFQQNYGKFSKVKSVTQESIEAWKQRGSALVVNVFLRFAGPGPGHATSVFFPPPHDGVPSRGIYFDSNFSEDNVYANQLAGVQSALAAFGLSVELAPCPRVQIQQFDHFCKWWSTWSAFLSVCQVAPMPRTEILQDLGLVGLLAFAKMAVDTIFTVFFKEYITQNSRKYAALPMSYPPLDLVPGPHHSAGVDRPTATFVSRVHWLRRAFQIRDGIPALLRDWEAAHQKDVDLYVEYAGEPWPWGPDMDKKLSVVEKTLRKEGIRHRFVGYLDLNRFIKQVSKMIAPSAAVLGRALSTSIFNRGGHTGDIRNIPDAPVVPDLPESGLGLDSEVLGLGGRVWALTEPDLTAVDAELAVIRLPPVFLDSLYAAADGFEARFERQPIN